MQRLGKEMQIVFDSGKEAANAHNQDRLNSRHHCSNALYFATSCLGVSSLLNNIITVCQYMQNISSQDLQAQNDWLRAKIAEKKKANAQLQKIISRKSAFANRTGPRKVTLKSHEGKFICAESNGKAPLIANRDYANLWEHFELVPVDRDYWAVRACVNGKFVRANGAKGERELMASAEEPDQMSTFVMDVRGNKIALKLLGNGKWVSAEWGQGSCLLANRDHAPNPGWEEFQIADVEEEE